MISFRNITKVYQAGTKPIVALSNVCFEVKPQEFVSIVGRSGAGKTTLAKEFCLRTRAMHIEIDAFSYMQRGRVWYTRSNSKEKMRLVIAVLSEALRCGRTRFCLDGGLIYPFMFKMIEDWCSENGVEFFPVKTIGRADEINLRVTRRMKQKYDWNAKLPEFYSQFNYPGQICVDTTDVDTDNCFRQVMKMTQHGETWKGISWDEISLGMLKPDCLKRFLRIEAIRRIESSGLSVLLERKTTLSDEDILVLYGHLTSAPFFPTMKSFLQSGEVSMLLISGKDAIRRMNSVVGFTDPSRAKVGTLRNIGLDLTNNIAHSAENRESVERGVKHFFPKSDLSSLGLV